jgi:hypothetical protein
MSPEPNGNGHIGDVSGRLVIVRVEDAIEPELTGHAGATYVSPPQPREQAMTLVRLLLASAGDAPGDGARWAAPIAGGRRVVTLSEEPDR